MKAASGLKVEWKNLVYTAKSADKKQETGIEILHSISGSALPGEFVAIMGPSGSGKTTLLNIVSSRASTGVEGLIRFNEAPPSRSSKKLTAYVMQIDLFFETLTVFDTLKYTALLRLPRTVPFAVKMQKVKSVMTQLGIEKCAKTKVGNAMILGISGGEKKRLNIANELLLDPSLFILDEPTSGLDSCTALSLVSTLSQMAVECNRTVVCSIHQPSSQIFAKFDKLILLTGGYIVYQGQACKAYEYFRELGFVCPIGFNTSDYIMDVLSEDANQDKLVEFYKKLLQVDRDGVYSMRIESTTGNPEMKVSTSSTPQLVDSDDEPALALPKGDSESQPRLVSDIPLYEATTGAALENTKKSQVGVKDHSSVMKYLYIIYVLFMRSVDTNYGTVLTLLNFIQTVIVAALVGIFWFQNLTKYNEKTVNDRVGVLFFLIMYHAFTPAFSALMTFPPERMIIAKERASKSYPISAYFLARSASDMPVQLFYPLVLLIIIYGFVGMPLTASHIFGTVLVMQMMVLVTHSLGLTISAAVPDFKTGATVVSVVLLSLMLSGGYFIEKSNIPIWIAWFAKLSFVDYAMNAMLYLNVHGRNFACAETSQFDECHNSDTFDGNVLLEAYEFTLNYWECIGVLLAMFAVLRLCCYLVLRHSKRMRLM